MVLGIFLTSLCNTVCRKYATTTTTTTCTSVYADGYTKSCNVLNPQTKQNKKKSQKKEDRTVCKCANCLELTINKVSSDCFCKSITETVANSNSVLFKQWENGKTRKETNRQTDTQR